MEAAVFYQYGNLSSSNGIVVCLILNPNEECKYMLHVSSKYNLLTFLRFFDNSNKNSRITSVIHGRDYYDVIVIKLE